MQDTIWVHVDPSVDIILHRLLELIHVYYRPEYAGLPTVLYGFCYHHPQKSWPAHIQCTVYLSMVSMFSIDQAIKLACAHTECALIIKQYLVLGV